MKLNDTRQHKSGTKYKRIPHLLASTDCEFFEGADVIDEEIHETQLVAEADQDVEAGGMQCDAVCFLCKHLVQLQVAAKQSHWLSLQMKIFLTV